MPERGCLSVAAVHTHLAGSATVTPCVSLCSGRRPRGGGLQSTLEGRPRRRCSSSGHTNPLTPRCHRSRGRHPQYPPRSGRARARAEAQVVGALGSG